MFNVNFGRSLFAAYKSTWGNWWLFARERDPQSFSHLTAPSKPRQRDFSLHATCDLSNTQSPPPKEQWHLPRWKLFWYAALLARAQSRRALPPGRPPLPTTGTPLLKHARSPCISSNYWWSGRRSMWKDGSDRTPKVLWRVSTGLRLDAMSERHASDAHALRSFRRHCQDTALVTPVTMNSNSHHKCTSETAIASALGLSDLRSCALRCYNWLNVSITLAKIPSSWNMSFFHPH